jgi:hypothetical protein
MAITVHSVTLLLGVEGVTNDVINVQTHCWLVLGGQANDTMMSQICCCVGVLAALLDAMFYQSVSTVSPLILCRRSEITAIQAGAERRRRKALSTTAVVGITCCSALQVWCPSCVFAAALTCAVQPSACANSGSIITPKPHESDSCLRQWHALL